jgi:ABC-2 type transport system ATP-binding protein
MGRAAIEVHGLSFEYPGVRALDDVSFRIDAGGVTALVGPNGSGKTTLFRCVAGLEQPLTGSVRLADIDVLEAPRVSHRKVGFLSDFFGLYDALSVRRCLAHAAASNGVPEDRVAETVERTAARMDLADKLERRAGELSRGQRQRVAIGQALVHGPEVLLLDEPASGLDPEARHSLAVLFRSLSADGVTLVVSSHILAELDEYSTHMLVLRGGRLIENRAVALAGVAGRRLRIVVAEEMPVLSLQLARVGGVRVVQSDRRSAIVEMEGGPAEQAALLARLVAAGMPVCELSEEREDLQASYLRTVTK